jgi:hypothetical protein
MQSCEMYGPTMYPSTRERDDPAVAVSISSHPALIKTIIYGDVSGAVEYRTRG